jgi:tetratricopeptide (TPR) repeat protein
MPDLPVAYTAEDYFEGRDPMMEAVLEYGVPMVTEYGLEPEDLEACTGRYCLSPYQVLTVEMAGGRLRFRVEDFLEGSWREVRSDLYPAGRNLFGTDVDGVELFFSGGPRGEADGVTLRWRGINTYAERAAEGYMVPMELFAAGKVSEAAAALYDDRDFYRREVPDLERRLNGMGYTFLRDGKDTDALKVFKLNVRLFPESGNTYDSLGEAYMISGMREYAIKNYERAVELNPANRNAAEKLEHLRKGETWDRENRRWTG